MFHNNDTRHDSSCFGRKLLYEKHIIHYTVLQTSSNYGNTIWFALRLIFQSQTTGGRQSKIMHPDVVRLLQHTQMDFFHGYHHEATVFRSNYLLFTDQISSIDHEYNRFGKTLCAFYPWLKAELTRACHRIS